MREMRGKPLASAVREWCGQRLSVLEPKRKMSLAILQVGDDPASTAYRLQKTKAVEALGGEVCTVHLGLSSSRESAWEVLRRWGDDGGVDGIFLEHPLPRGWEEELRLLIPLRKDVEGMHPLHLGQMYLGSPRVPVPCTAEAAVLLPEWHGFGDFSGKEAVVLGRSASVGRAVALLLQHRHATVTVLHSRSAHTEEHLASAEVVVAAVGQPGVVRGAALRSDAVVVDVGTHVREDGTLVGDVLWEDDEPRRAFTPVPGGVGPVTVALLLKNLVVAYAENMGSPCVVPTLEDLRRYATPS